MGGRREATDGDAAATEDAALAPVARPQRHAIGLSDRSPPETASLAGTPGRLCGCMAGRERKGITRADSVCWSTASEALCPDRGRERERDSQREPT